jgi:hypothetical protein
VIDDVRFLNEATMIKETQGILIYINRPFAAKDLHRSETEMELIKPDWSVLNHTDLDGLFERTDSILQIEFKDEINGGLRLATK